MTNATWKYYAVRGLAAILIGCGPLLGEHNIVPLAPIFLGALLAYDGSDGPIIGFSIIFLIVYELIWGLPLGMLTASYIATMLFFRYAQHFVSAPSLSHEYGWPVSSFIKTVLTAWVLSAILMTISVFVLATLYHQGAPMSLVESAWQPLYSVIFTGMIVSGIIITFLHRADVPFHRRIRFGT